MYSTSVFSDFDFKSVLLYNIMVWAVHIIIISTAWRMPARGRVYATSPLGVPRCHGDAYAILARLLRREFHNVTGVDVILAVSCARSSHARGWHARPRAALSRGRLDSTKSLRVGICFSLVDARSQHGLWLHSRTVLAFGGIMLATYTTQRS